MDKKMKTNNKFLKILGKYWYLIFGLIVVLILLLGCGPV